MIKSIRCLVLFLILLAVCAGMEPAGDGLVKLKYQRDPACDMMCQRQKSQKRKRIPRPVHGPVPKPRDM